MQADRAAFFRLEKCDLENLSKVTLVHRHASTTEIYAKLVDETAERAARADG